MTARRVNDHASTEFLARGELSLTVEVTADWSHEPGDIANGYNGGWTVENVECRAVDATGQPVKLTAAERRKIAQSLTPPNP